MRNREKLCVLAVVAMAVPLIGQPSSASATARGPHLSGATVMLPNLDDDQRRCRVDPADLEALGGAVDAALAACHDAGDERVNGSRDAEDLARVFVRPTPGLSRSATGQLGVDRHAYARVFVKRDNDFRALVPGTGTLTGEELRSGVELAVEGRDIVRDPARWDGTVLLTLTVTDRGHRWRDDHRMRVAPLLLQHDLQPATTVFAGRPGKGTGAPWWGGVIGDWVPSEWEAFSSTLRTAAGRTGARTRFIASTEGLWQDVWWQDLFEPATASMPTVGGVQTMRVMIRSANVWDLPDASGNPVRTPRPAARLLFRDLRGPDVAVVQQFGAQGHGDLLTDLRNATGNIESLPPYRGFPQGRLVYGTSPGGGELAPDPDFIRMLVAQGQQPPVVLDTSWLLVGHADETMHVVRATNERGWTLMVADPRLAERLLRQAHAHGAGSARLFAGTNAKRQPTVAELLDDPSFLAHNEAAAGHIDKQVAVMLAETGLRPDEMVRVPVLFEQINDLPLFVALTPGIPNGLSLTARDFAAPDPHGPVVDGRDLFRATTERALARGGVRVHWVEDLFWAHFGGGEVHCTTNAWRDTRGGTPWWITSAAG
ncbi:protein-arginine deiminase family protein [Phytohabitans sp. LJ34]|uniref:protein-arginine deiminase family protein n=1 Tax=Phytohabitans sp. LJ34 TaxID=3452217 RepID=UPI003F8A9450